MTETIKVADDIFMVPWDQGNGQIRREVWIDKQGKIARYNLAYINPETSAEEDGRVLGYDFHNGKCRSHLKGTVAAIDLSSLEDMEDLFDIKWSNLAKECGVLTSPGESSPGEIDLNKLDETDEYAETKGMKLTITKGNSEDFFRRGKELARKLDRGEHVEPEKVVIFGHRQDLCYTMLPK